MSRAAPRLGVLALGVGLIGVAYLSAWLPAGTRGWGTGAMVVGCALTLAGMLALGGRGAHAARRLVIGAAILQFVIVLLGLGLPFVLPPERADAALFLGLPIRAAIEIYGVAVLPAVIFPLLFARDFRRRAIDPATLQRIRAARPAADDAG